MAKSTPVFTAEQLSRWVQVAQNNGKSAPKKAEPDYRSIMGELNRRAAARAKTQPKKEQDNFWRPAGQALNRLASLGYGTTGMYSKLLKSVEESAVKLKNGDVLGGIGQAAATLVPGVNAPKLIGDYTSSVADAWTDNHKELRTTSDIIEQVPDMIGKGDPNYVDVEDNVNPWVKGIGGFVGDVALDPLTYIPGGAIIAATKGGTKAGVAAGKALTGSDLAKTAKMVDPRVTLPGAKAGVEAWQVGQQAEKLAKSNVKLIKKGKATPEQMAQVAGTFGKKRSAKLAGQNSAFAANLGRHTAEAGVAPAAKVVEDVLPGAAAGAAKMTDDGAPIVNTMDDVEDIVTAERAADDPMTPAPGQNTPAPTGPGAAAAAAALKLADEAGEVDATAGKLAETQIREDLIKGANDPVAIAAAAVKGHSDEHLKLLRTLTYDKIAMEPKLRTAARALTVFPRINRAAAIDEAALDAQKAVSKEWMENVAAIFPDRKDQIALRRIEDPALLTAKVEELVNRKVEVDYKNASVGELLGTKGKPGVLNIKTRKHNEEKLAEIAKSFGWDKRSMIKGETSFADLLRRKNATGKLNKMVKAEREAQTLFQNAAVHGGEAIERLAPGVDPQAAIRAAESDFNDVLSGISDLKAAIFHAAFPRAMGNMFGRPKDFKYTRKTRTDTEDVYISDVKLGEKGKAQYRNIFEQSKTYSFTKLAISGLSAIATQQKLTGPARAMFMWQGIRDEARMLDSYLRTLGISPVAGKHAIEATAYKTKQKSEFAFLGFSDVLNVIPDTLGAELFAGLRSSLPPTVVHDAGRWALKIAGEPGSASDHIVGLAQFIHNGVRQMPGNESALFAKSDAGRDLINRFAAQMMSPESIQKLSATNVRNGVFARAIVGEKAHAFSEPIRKVLEAALKAPSGTIGSDVDAVLESVEELRKVLGREGAIGTSTETLAKFDLDTAMSTFMDLGTAKAIRATVHMKMRTKVDAGGKPLKEETAAKLEEKYLDLVSAKGKDGKPAKPKKAKPSPAHEAAVKAATKGANTARAEQVSDLSEQIDEAVQSVIDGIGNTSSTDKLADLDNVRAQLTMGMPAWMRAGYRFGVAMSGGFGMRGMKIHEIQETTMSRYATAAFSHALAEVKAAHSNESIQGALRYFQTMPSNDSITNIPQGLDRGIRAAAEMLHPVIKNVLDHSPNNWYARAGLDSDYVRTAMLRAGVPEHFTPVSGHSGWEVGRQWTRWEFTEETMEGLDPLEIVRRIHVGQTQAQVMPNIAASFSAEFGHRSSHLGAAMTDAEAKAAGWQRIDTNHDGIGRFVDSEQYYHPEMIKEITRMDDFLSKSRSLDGDSFFEKTFRMLDPVINSMKASITLWRPGHHVTNMLGEGIMNTLAGVYNPAHYAKAISVMKTHGLMEGADTSRIAKFLAENAPEGRQLKPTNDPNGVFITLNGKTQKYTPDSVFRMLAPTGIIVHHSYAEDIIDGAERVIKGGLQANLNKMQKLMTPEWLGNVSASRDNVFRIAHAIKLLEGKSYGSIPDMLTQVSKEVFSYHPTMQTLSQFEQKYVRRVVYFYTWQRQALTRVMESMLDTPGRVTAAAKGLYNVSEANGVDPQSFGEIMPNDERIPEYTQGNITSFLWKSPNAEYADMPDNFDDTMIWGASISAPQLDILQSIFGDIRTDPRLSPQQGIGDGVTQFMQGMSQNLTPVAKIPIELGTGSKLGNGGVVKDPTEYLIDQTGLGYPSRLGMLGERTDKPEDPAMAEERVKSGITNWFTGMKMTNYTSPKAATSAERLRREHLKRLVEAGVATDMGGN